MKNGAIIMEPEQAMEMTIHLIKSVELGADSVVIFHTEVQADIKSLEEGLIPEGHVDYVYAGPVYVVAAKADIQEVLKGLHSRN